ncbi:MAG TPA: DUF3040 domain-containing protein [Streptosporangiaceae bacterium]
MSLPPRQQRILDEIEQALQGDDSRMTSMFAAFGRAARAHDMPATEVISGRSVRRTVLICLMLASILGGLVFGIRATSNDCPGLSSDQVVAGAAIRYAGCTKSTDVWSKGAR